MSTDPKQIKFHDGMTGHQKLQVVEARSEGRAVAAPQAPAVYLRNRLVSKMLQNRSALRIICAPRGYGKSALAGEYAERMFGGKRVEWVDASTPAFLADLDRGRLSGFDELRGGQPALMVLDDVPWLHEQRAETLARRLETALYRGVEVVAVTLPSCDCLSARHAERVFVGAAALELTEEDCHATQSDKTPSSRARAARMWRQAREEALGKVPSVAWGGGRSMRGRVLEWFFGEGLPVEVQRAAFALMLLGPGPLSDLARVGVELRDEDLRLLARDYPFLCIDMAQGTSSMPCCPLGELRHAMEEGGACGLFGSRAGIFVGKALGILVERGDVTRIEEAIEVFCSDDQCACWLLDSGWELLDRGEAELVDTLLGRAPDNLLRDSADLQVLRAWASGLVGDARGASYFAQRALRADRGGSCDDERHRGLRALAYLALVAFGGNGASIYGKDEFSSGCEPVTAASFISRVVDLCSESEIARAFCRPGRETALESSRSEADDERVRALSALFSAGAVKFAGHACYRLAFHLMCFIDGEALKPVVQAVGCEIALQARRRQRLTCTEALVTRDLWRTGFFGGLGARGGKHDARLLEDAGRAIRRAAALRGEESPDVPWDIESRFQQQSEKRARPHDAHDGAPLVHVRLFGGFEVTVGDRYIKDGDWRKKSRLLVLLVVLHQGRDVSRDSLLEQLWPGMSRVRAKDNFYSAWSNACGILGDGPHLERTGSFCRANPRYLISDVSEFEQLARRLLTEHPDTNTLLDMYARIESLYRGELIPGERDNSFINAQRERCQATYVDAMITATECALKVKDARLALWFARKAREAGPGREDVYQALIRAQVAAGQRCSAIRSYFECRQFLRDELGLDPSLEVQDLYNKLISVDPTLTQLEPSSFQRR